MHAMTNVCPWPNANSVAVVPPTVFIVDEDDSTRESLEPLVREAGWQAQSCSTPYDLLDRPRLPEPSCLLLDVSSPSRDSLALQKRMAADRADMPIIFMSNHGDISLAVQAIKAGAVEFLTKPLTPEILLAAIRNAFACSREILNAEAKLQALRRRHELLSRREREVMALIVKGRLNKLVGAELGICEITVKAHRGQVMRKMHAKSLLALVNMAARLGLETAATG